MNAPPIRIDDAVTLWYVFLGSEYQYTENAKHYVGGNRIGSTPALAICQYLGDSAYYLFRCDETWKTVTDTCHDSIEAAMNQAAFEYDGLTSKKWKHYSSD